MRYRVPPDPHAYYERMGSWHAPADKHVPPQISPPYGCPKFPPVKWRDDWPVMLLTAGLLGLAGLFRLVRGDW